MCGTSLLYLQQSKPAKAWEALTAHAAYMEAPTLLFAPFLSDLARVQKWPEMVLMAVSVAFFLLWKKTL
jgi:hypothetical protein